MRYRCTLGHACLRTQSVVRERAKVLMVVVRTLHGVMMAHILYLHPFDQCPRRRQDAFVQTER